MTKFNADTVDEFMDVAKKKFDDDDLGKTRAYAAYSYSFKEGKLARSSKPS